MRILVTAVFEQVVYHCACVDDRDPDHPRLEVDAILRAGDADGPVSYTHLTLPTIYSV